MAICMVIEGWGGGVVAVHVCCLGIGYGGCVQRVGGGGEAECIYIDCRDKRERELVGLKLIS